MAEIVEHAGRLQHIGAVRIRAEAVQDEERGAPFGRVQILGHAEHAMQAQARGFEADDLFFCAFWHAVVPSSFWPAAL